MSTAQIKILILKKKKVKEFLRLNKYIQISWNKKKQII